MKYNDFNYYENECYRLLVVKNQYKDKFYIALDNDTQEIYVERVDASVSWGQDLKISVFNKLRRDTEIVTIGSSNDYFKRIKYPHIKGDDVEKERKLHYEGGNESFKLFSISREFNDIFKVDYDEGNKTVIVKRMDAVENIGWGQNLFLKYVEKISGKEKIINIGPSKENVIKVMIDLHTFPYRLVHNYFENDNYIISIYDNKYNDLFEFNFYEESSTIYAKRVDSNEGWGQNLRVRIFNVMKNETFIVYIGASIKNEIYKKVELVKRKVFVALTTIPSRIKLGAFYENIRDLVENGNGKRDGCEIENIFITIAKKYKRFNEKIDESVIEKIRSLSSKIIFIELEEDYGPASKYLGPLLKYYSVLDGNIMIVVDDDRKYNPNLVMHFKMAYNSFPNVVFSSGLWNIYFDKGYAKKSDEDIEMSLFKEQNANTFYYGNGLGGFFGFAMKVVGLETFIEYHFKVFQRIPKAFYHDEGISLGYLKYFEENIIFLNHKGCNFIKDEMVDALCNANYVNRGNIEKEILQITNFERLM